MPQKPAENMTVTVSWNEYKVLKDRAISENTNIKDILDKLVRDYLEGDTEAPSQKKVYACPECGKEWETKKQLRGHMQKHDQGLTNEDAEKYKKRLDDI